MAFIHQLCLLAIGTCLMMTRAMPMGTPEQQVIRSPSSSQAAASLLNQVLSSDSDEDAYFGLSWFADAGEEEEEEEEEEEDVNYGFVFNLFGSDDSSADDDVEPLSDDKDAVNAAMLMVSSSDIDDNVIEMAILARTRQIFSSHRRLVVSVHSDHADEEEDLDYMSDT